METAVDLNILLKGFIEVLKILAAGSIGFVTALLILRKQLNEFRIEKKKNRKIEACNVAINSITAFLESITEFSNINSQIMRETNEEFNLTNIHKNPQLHELYIRYSGWQEILNNYRKALTETWRAYGFLRLNCDKARSDEIKDFTDYLNTFLEKGEDVNKKWEEMQQKANINIEKMKEEIENTK